MIDLGLSASDLAEYLSALGDSRPMKTKVYLFNRNEQLESEVTLPLHTGQVAFDMDADISRQADVTFVDPGYEISFDKNSAADYVIYYDRFLHIVREDYVASLDRWIGCPIFFGPIASFARLRSTVNVTAMGKEMMHLDPELVWENFHQGKGTLVTTAIRELLELHGETKFDLPALSDRLQTRLDLARSGSIKITKLKKGKKGKKKVKVEKEVEDEPWVAAKNLARRSEHLLFFDGRGRARMKPFATNPVWTFSTGEDGDIITYPELSFDMGTVRNVVEVYGEPPKGKWAQVRAVATPESNHPLSPESLAHNGKPRRLIEREEDSKITTPDQAAKRARRLLDESLEDELDISFDALPLPPLEEGDRANLDDNPRMYLTFQPKKWVIPLTATGTMSVGELRRTESEFDRIHVKKRGKKRKKRKKRKRKK